MNRGEVRWANFSSPDKRRPVVLLTRDPVLRKLSQIMVATVTTTVRGLSVEVRLDQTDGMPSACAVNLDQINTIPKSMLGERITQLSEQKMNLICAALHRAAGCSA
jgi:mRNA interferase MazF